MQAIVFDDNDVLLPECSTNFERKPPFEKVIVVPVRMRAVPDEYLITKNCFADGDADFVFRRLVKTTVRATIVLYIGTTDFPRDVIYSHRAMCFIRWRMRE